MPPIVFTTRSNTILSSRRRGSTWVVVYENREPVAGSRGLLQNRLHLLNPVYYQAFSSLAKVLWELRIT